MNLMNYFDFSANNIIGMCVSLFMLIAICIWAQSFRKKTRNIIGNRNKFFIFSIILIVVSVLSLLKYGVNYGLDFTGGTIVEVGFQNNVTAEQIREALIKINPSYSEAVIQLEKKDSSEPGPTKCLIRVREVISAKGVASDKPNEESI